MAALAKYSQDSGNMVKRKHEDDVVTVTPEDQRPQEQRKVDSLLDQNTKASKEILTPAASVFQEVLDISDSETFSQKGTAVAHEEDDEEEEETIGDKADIEVVSNEAEEREDGSHLSDEEEEDEMEPQLHEA